MFSLRLEAYKMNHNSRGYAVIINNNKFDSKDFEELEGQDNDVKNLKKTFKKLRFKENEIKEFENQTKIEMLDIMCEYAKKDFTECDCLIVAFLSHGYFKR